MKKPPVLQDHKRKGKKLVTPLNDLPGGTREISYRNFLMPELIWIALIQQKFGEREGVRLITALTRKARELMKDDIVFAAATSFSKIPSAIAHQMRDEFSPLGDLKKITTAIAPLVAWYPDCPLRCFFSELPEADQDGLGTIKKSITSLYQRDARAPMMVQATAVWLMFDAEKLKVNEGLSLASFPEIEHYPDTELSRSVGAGVRMAVNMLFSLPDSDKAPSSPWARYFWNRGLDLEPCEFSYG